MPSFREEKKLWQKGYKRVAGLDESGRGPLAGPVVAATVFLEKDLISNIYNLKSILKDSKKLSSKKREEFYKIITKNPAIEWGIGQVSEKVIDKINILEATKLAMERALKNLGQKLKKRKIQKTHDRRKNLKLQKTSDRLNFVKIDFLILDGKMKLDLKIPQKSIIKADQKVFSCVAASIIAKVWRDRIMQRYHKKYPRYGFDQHKGYPTRLHRRMLKKYRPCKIHRKSFKPVKTCSHTRWSTARSAS